MYYVVFRTRFERIFKKLDRKTQELVLNEIERLAKNPFDHPQIRAIVGIPQKAYRLRIGRWRVLYFVLTSQQTIEVIDLFLRQGTSDYRAL